MLDCGHLEKTGLGVVPKQEDWGTDMEEDLRKRTLGARKEDPKGGEQVPKITPLH